MKLTDLLKNSCVKYPNRVAITDGIREISYLDLYRNSCFIGNYLSSLGYGPGTRIALVFPNSADYFLGFFGILFAGAAVVPMYARMTPHEGKEFIGRADISAVLTDISFASKLEKILPPDKQVSVLTLRQQGNAIEFEVLKQCKPSADNEGKCVSLMVYTSGTSGQSKIAMLTDEQLISNMLAYVSVMRFEHHNIVYCALPLHHIYSICAQLLTHIYLGDTFVTNTNPFFIKDFMRAVEIYRITISAFVPYMALLMSQYPIPDQFDLSTLQYITLSGAKTPPAVYCKLSSQFDHINFVNTYGMSEAGSRVSIAAPDPRCFPIASVGKPLPGVKVRIMNQDNSVAGPNSVGEIEIKSSGVFQGYFKQPRLTEETIFEGWLKTGDLGKFDADGNLYLVGRKKEIIICGGENILPAEIEETLMEHELISEAVVIGLPDEKFQEVPCAFVKLKDGCTKESEIKKFCQMRISSYKVPRHFYFIDDIPKLGSSKVDRGKLKQIAINLTGQQL